MNRGELLTRITIWIAISGYALSTAILLLRGKNLVWQSRARWLSTVGCLGLMAHTICAFHFYHDWSQASALRETARQTAEVTGANWGGGLYINYGFLAAWIADVAWWWRGLNLYRQRHWLITAIWHGFFIFMLFNATVVFKTGWVRWLGLGICLGLLATWLNRHRVRQQTI
ncbi:MAG: hypothetical protein AB7P14_27060 [Blastocatellales bacterium]